MTKKEILNTPEIVDFMIDKSVMVDSKMKLHKRLDELCKLAIKALEQEPCEDCISRKHLLEEIASLKESPWFKDDTNHAMAIRKEAIEIVEDLCIRKEPSVNQQEPCEDCISRQAAKRALEDRFIELQKRHDDKRCETNYCLNTILELPPVTRLSKTGYWIYELEDWNRWTCSECGWSERTDVHITLGYNYCPNCGCHMIKVRNKE